MQLALSEEAAQDVGCQRGDAIVDEDGARVGDRTGREDGTAGRGVEIDHVAAALVRISAFGEQPRPGWSTRRQLVRFVSRGAAHSPPIERRVADQIAFRQAHTVERPVVCVPYPVWGA